jgi:opine dehydrogenase
MEINEIFKILGLIQFRFCKWVNKSYGINQKSIYKSIQGIKAYKNIDAPKDLITRYFTEDVPTGLVPISSIAKLLKVETPIIDSVINLSSILCGRDFRNEGRTIANLDLGNFIKKRITSEELVDSRTEQEILIN